DKMNVNSGAWSIDTGPGATSGVNLATVIDGSTSSVAFVNSQTLKRLELKNGGTASFTGSGIMLSGAELAVTAGTGNIDMQTGSTTGNVTSSFAISAGCTLVKKGSGTLQVFAPQAHGAGATLDVKSGLFVTNTDGGSVSTRTLSVDCES